MAVAREATRGVEFLSQYAKVAVVTVCTREREREKRPQRSPMTTGVGEKRMAHPSNVCHYKINKSVRHRVLFF